MPRCPKCRTQTALIPYEGVKIHHCGSCGGNWLTDAKLDLILARRDQKFAEPIAERLEEMAAESASTEALLCLPCGTEMKRQSFRAWKEVQLDVCPRCDGIWFDRAELEKCQMLWEAAKSDPKKMAVIEKQAAAEVEMLRARQENAEFRETLSESRDLGRPGSMLLDVVWTMLRWRSR